MTNKEKIFPGIFVLISLLGFCWILFFGEDASPENPLLTPLILLIPLALALAFLASFSHKTASGEWNNLLIIWVIGLDFMVGSTLPKIIALGGVIVLIAFPLLEKSRSRFSAFWGIGLYGLALASLLASSVVSPSMAPILLLFTYATLLPLCPLHGASIVSSRLKGGFPNFLALFLPVLGLKGVLTILPDLPSEILDIVSVFALVGAVYGGIRALVQNNIRTRLAYAGLTFWSILWWYLANTGLGSAPAILYFCAFALILQGLFISASCLENRQGEVNLDQLGGLARRMPRFGVLLSLLVAAAMGLPLFGSFTALVAMATSPAITLSWGFAIVLLSWLLASWHFPVFMQRILMGPTKLGRVYGDLVLSEMLSLCLIVCVIIMLGIAPYAFFGQGQTLPLQEVTSRLK